VAQVDAVSGGAIAPPRAVIGEPCADVPPLDRTDDGKLSSFALALLFAFLGGLILNAMPCVLPVLSLKILGIVEQAKDSPQTVWRHGLFYTAGVLASFLVMAILLIALQQTSWAFQFQDPVFVGVFTAIVFAFSLSLFGVFEIGLPGASKIDAAVAGSHGYASSFNYGIFAVLLGTPCTAPFLGPALTFAFTQPPFEMTLLLLSVGLGLAFPFLLLARFPGWRKILPKPGAWLMTFKKVMAFFLVGTAVFLLSIFAAQVSREALVSYLVFLTLLALSLFIYGNWTEPSRSPRVRWVATAVALGLTVWSAITFVSVDPPEGTGPTMTAGGITWHDFDRIDVNARASDGHLVFVDFTADWCTTCKVNEATAIHTDEVRDLIHALGVLPVKGDFTQYKPEIAKWLEKYEEPSVPLYVVIPPGRPDEAFKLPTLLSESDVKSGLCDAYRLANASN
ncbi:MAG TPA: thioredoxin family protein, partial [Myxococcota bacterium]|nr:thioredoxin family protein [Myxococcota bacterium]